MFDSDILFKQVLSLNIKFKKYINNFNIDSFIDNYLNLSNFIKIKDLSHLIWINQNKKSMEILKKFKYNKKLFEMNFLINVSNFNFIKIIFTNIFDNTIFNNKSLEILMKII